MSLRTPVLQGQNTHTYTGGYAAPTAVTVHQTLQIVLTIAQS